MKPEQIRASSEVEAALQSGGPVVALESTIISHGMPYPTNFETALVVERIIRDGGAVPATVAVLGGVIRCGLREDEIRILATDKDVLKAGERDIPLACSRGCHAGTTVGATLAVASALGIRVFATGGFGGVAIGAGETFDISADLLAFAEYQTIAVCAGAKAFMDIPATLEYLETHGVLVAAYKSSTFPFFYSRDSGQKVDWSAQSVGEIVDVFVRKISVGLGGGIVVGVPLPEEEALPEDQTRHAIWTAIDRCTQMGITGKEVTPYLLKTIGEETGGRSLLANTALIKNNAKVAAEIAVTLCKRLRASPPIS